MIQKLTHIETEVTIIVEVKIFSYGEFEVQLSFQVLLQLDLKILPQGLD